MKTKKPTGDGICPPEIQQAHYIDGLINEWASTHNLGNSDFNDVKGDKTEPLTDDDNIPAVEPCVAVAYSSCNNVPVPWYTACGTAATELLNSLSNAFDSPVQRAHDEDQASQLLANIQSHNNYRMPKHAMTSYMVSCSICTITYMNSSRLLIMSNFISRWYMYLWHKKDKYITICWKKGAKAIGGLLMEVKPMHGLMMMTTRTSGEQWNRK